MNYTLVIPAGGTRSINCGAADFFAVVLSPTDLLIAMPGEEPALFGQGDSRELLGGKIFKRLEVRNPSTADVTVIIFAGFDRYEQRRQQIIEPKKRVAGRSGSLAAGGDVDLSPTLSPGDIRRKHVVVSNPDTALKLECLDASGVRFQVIQPGDSAIVDVSEKFFLHNPNGSPVQYALGEVFWTV